MVKLSKERLGVFINIVAYTCLYPGLFWPSVRLEGQHKNWDNKGSASTQRSTVDAIFELYSRGFMLTSMILLFFSVLIPCMKLLLFVSSLFKPLLKVNSNEFLDTRRVLRLLAKYQMVDVYVAVITAAYVRTEIVHAELLTGFYFFLFYCLLSIVSAQLLDSNSYGAQESVASDLEKFLLFTSSVMFVAGLGWALFLPFLTVRFYFQGRIVLAEKTLAMGGLIWSLFTEGGWGSFCLGLLCLFCVIVAPCIYFCLSLQALIIGKKPQAWLGEWSHLDVFSISLVTALFVINSFDTTLRAAVPWGFYSVLMAGMSDWEVNKKFLLPIIIPLTRYDSLSDVEEGEKDFELAEPVRIGRSSSDEGGMSSRSRAKSQSISPVARKDKTSYLSIFVEIVRKLGVPFFLLKALGWVVFFAVWIANSSHPQLDLSELNQTLESNLPLVSASLASVLPERVGDGKLFYERGTTVETLARYLEGFKSVNVTRMRLSSSNGKMVLSVNGSFNDIALSLFIGQCLSPDNLFHDKTVIPSCDQVWDSMHNWTNVKWSVKLTGNCHSKRPFVSQVRLDHVSVDSPMQVQQAVLGGLVKLNLDDLSNRFKEGIQSVLKPLMEGKDPWIPWGDKKYELGEFLSQIVALNTHAGEDNIQCP